MAIQEMSKKPQRATKRRVPSESAKTRPFALKTDENSLVEGVVGSANVKRWHTLKEAFSCKTNEDFATKLLDLAQEVLSREPCKQLKENDNPKKDTKEQPDNRTKRKRKEAKKKKSQDSSVINQNKSLSTAKTFESNSLKLLPCQPDVEEGRERRLVEELPEITPALELVPPKQVAVDEVLHKPLLVDSDRSVIEEKVKKKKISLNVEKAVKKDKPPESKKKIDSVDIRKAPVLDAQSDNKVENSKATDEPVINKLKIRPCHNCNTRHVLDQCPLKYPKCVIPDAMSLEEWQERYQKFTRSDTETGEARNDENDKFSFSAVSLPCFLQLLETNSDHGPGVWVKRDIQEFTQFGPLIGKIVKEVDISEDSTMRDLWELYSENGSTYFNTEDPEGANWVRFIRPAPSREEKNLIVVARDGKLYFISVKPIKNGDELLYWQDSEVPTNKKKMEKTSCGGCNMTFTHPLYYRIHCSVFHDVRYSLTIRKYHCKICGVAVLGKENIMKHAAELHNGQGAYQCQFCKKFFLRLNYLEMHRTYGCSANPHRSRPLCDFCGRKFCQPQKLKVHIKRMHSDFSVVLKEFQCKICMKILGSRAALQRHSKEVHQKQVDVACSCNRCGKRFQNKSNLKIHMLTHSGIKPFKCVVKSCSAAFTTKQCLQFHYKKVHSFNEEVMPKIERSIDYTFEAYSGVEDQDEKRDEIADLQQNDSNTAILDGESDIDETSMDSKNLDDPPAIQSPLQVTEEHSPEPNRSPPSMETYNMNSVNVTMKILSKGSKKWIADQPLLKSEMYQIEHRPKDDLSLQVHDPQPYDRPKLNTNLTDFTRHEASNASLLVEAALDSVCSEPNIDIDVSSTSNCTDALVSNLYTLAPPDTLTDVTYSETVCINEPRDINLISPSVNDHISVTDELNDELRHNQNIGMDYSGFHHEDFSPANSPEMHHRSSFVRNYINNLSSQSYSQIKSSSPGPVPSPPRYDFGHAVNTDHLSSDDSNGMAAQNLSLHSKHDIQLDLSIYKSPYKLESSSFRRMKFDDDIDKTKYNIGLEGASKNYGDDEANLENDQVDSMNNDLSDNIQVVDLKDKNGEETSRKYHDDLSSDMRAKFDIDLDLRIKNYDVDSENLRPPRGLYESNDLDFRSKNYDLIESNLENRGKSYENALDSDFRPDRNFEPLVLNSSELQGLDMSARSFHNYTNINRYHHLYPDVDRVDLRLNYSPPAPSYTHADILRVVSLDLTPPGRHSVDLSLRSHSLHQIANSRLLSDHAMQTNPHRLLDQGRLLGSDLSTARHLTGLTETGGRILSDHTTNRILSGNDQLTSNHLLGSDQRLMGEDSRLISEQPRLLEQTRLIGDGRILPPTTPGGAVSPVPTFSGYSVSQSPYHPTALAPRPHVSSPTPGTYHHYSSYY